MGAKAVTESQEILIITTEGVIIRTSVAGISTLGRITSGVRLMNINLDRGVRIASFALVREVPEQEKDMTAADPEDQSRSRESEEEEVLIGEDAPDPEDNAKSESEEEFPEDLNDEDLDPEDLAARKILMSIQDGMISSGDETE